MVEYYEHGDELLGSFRSGEIFNTLLRSLLSGFRIITTVGMECGR
jgi:hypothetical protein